MIEIYPNGYEKIRLNPLMKPLYYPRVRLVGETKLVQATPGYRLQRGYRKAVEAIAAAETHCAEAKEHFADHLEGVLCACGWMKERNAYGVWECWNMKCDEIELPVETEVNHD